MVLGGARLGVVLVLVERTPPWSGGVAEAGEWRSLRSSSGLSYLAGDEKCVDYDGTDELKLRLCPADTKKQMRGRAWLLAINW
jgi:hypothetical protein